MNSFSHHWTYQESYLFPPALIPLVLPKFLAEHVTGLFRLPILVAPCWMEALWLPTVLGMLAGISLCPIVKHLTMDVSIGWVLKSLQSLHLTLWLLRCVLHRQSSVCQVVAGVISVSTTKVYQQYWKEWAGMCASEGVPKNAISAPILLIFWFTYLGMA